MHGVGSIADSKGRPMAETEIVEGPGRDVGLETGRGRLPLGITLIAALLAILGIGSMGAATYLLLTTENANIWLAATAVAAGPAIIYLSYHLLRLAPWTWRTLTAVLILLTISSVVRLIVTPGLAIAPVAEILVELGGLYHLTRPRVRKLFRRPA